MIDFQARLPRENVARFVRVLLVAVLGPDALVNLTVVNGALHAPGPRCHDRKSPRTRLPILVLFHWP